MKLPDFPRKGASVEKCISDIIRYLRASRITGVRGGRVEELPGGTTLILEPGQPKANRPHHPFQILVTTDAATDEIRLFVYVGRASTIAWRTQGSGPVPYTYDIPVSFNGGGDLSGDAFGAYGGSPGYEVISAALTYGVWAVFAQSGSSQGSGTLQYQNVTSKGWSSGTIGVSADYTDPEDAADYTADLGSPGYGVVYLGRVTVDSEGVPTIQQYRKSDLVLPALSLPAGLISAEAGNSLSATFTLNPGLYVPPIVSTDADNSITAGSDGGAFYDAP